MWPQTGRDKNKLTEVLITQKASRESNSSKRSQRNGERKIYQIQTIRMKWLVKWNMKLGTSRRNLCANQFSILSQRHTWDNQLIKRKRLFWLSFRGFSPRLVGPMALWAVAAHHGKRAWHSKTTHLMTRK